jgi:hypothetical protein
MNPPITPKGPKSFPFFVAMPGIMVWYGLFQNNENIIAKVGIALPGSNEFGCPISSVKLFPLVFINSNSQPSGVIYLF